MRKPVKPEAAVRFTAHFHSRQWRQSTLGREIRITMRSMDNNAFELLLWQEKRGEIEPRHRGGARVLVSSMSEGYCSVCVHRHEHARARARQTARPPARAVE